jgi:hypothetical protein
MLALLSLVLVLLLVLRSCPAGWPFVFIDFSCQLHEVMMNS